MKTTIRCLFFSCLIVPLLGIGSHALAQKAAPLSEQEKTAIGAGTSGAAAPTSITDKKLPAAKVIKKKPASAAATSITPKPSTSIKKTTALPATPAYTPPAAKSVTKKPASATATSVTSTPSTSIRKTATLPVKPSYTPPATSAPSTAAGEGTAVQGQGYKPPTSPFVKPSYTPPAVSVPSKTIGVGTAVQGQGIQTPSGSYVTPMYDPPRSGPLGSGTPAGQSGSVTATPRSGSTSLFPVSVGTGTSGQEQGNKSPGSFLTPSSAGDKETKTGSEAAPAFSGSTPPPVVDNAERLQQLREKYGKTEKTSDDAMSNEENTKTVGGKKETSGVITSKQAADQVGTASGGKAVKTAPAEVLVGAPAISASTTPRSERIVDGKLRPEDRIIQGGEQVLSPKELGQMADKLESLLTALEKTGPRAALVACQTPQAGSRAFLTVKV